MNLHEYQAKALLARYGVAVPRGRVAATPAEAEAAARELAAPVVAVKAQIHAGGRGKGGGVRLARGPAEAAAAAAAILGMRLVTPQTGPQGRVVRKVLVEEGCEIARELYAGLVLDRSVGRLVLMASAEGGGEIEEVAARAPERVLREPIDPAFGLQPFQARKLAFGLGLRGEAVGRAVALFTGLYRAAVENDCTLAEINPLVVTRSGALLALDAKLVLDDNALFRHPDLEALRDPEEEDPREREARRHDLAYIALDGTIGCLVNGAGLAMATMDLIKLHGGEPANFLDVGGGASAEKVTAAFKLILADPRVKAILVNIFGGIMRCDVIATGIVAAAREVGLRVPLVVRLEGTNVELGRRILADSGLPVVTADGLRDAAEKVVRAAR